MARKNKNDEGSVFVKRKKGVEIGWVAQVTIGHYENGKPRTKQVLCQSKPEAEAKKYEMLASIRLGKDVDPQKVTIAEWLTSWFEVSYRPNNAQNTVALAEGHIKTHILPGIGYLQIRKITSLQIENFINNLINKSKLKFSKNAGKPLVISAKRQIRNLLKTYLDLAVEEKIISFNPVRITKPPRKPKEETVEITPNFKEQNEEEIDDTETSQFPIQEMQIFLKIATSRHFHLLWRILFETGLRIDEAMALRWDKVNLETGILQVHRTAGRNADGSTRILNRTKTDASKREIKVSTELLKFLKKWKAEQNVIRLENSTTW